MARDWRSTFSGMVDVTRPLVPARRYSPPDRLAPQVAPILDIPLLKERLLEFLSSPTGPRCIAFSRGLWAVVSVPIGTNEQLRESRLFKSMSGFMRRSGSTMIRVYTTHEPLKVFLTTAALFFAGAMVPFGRFFYFYLRGDAGGHIQSLILGLLTM